MWEKRVVGKKRKGRDEQKSCVDGSFGEFDNVGACQPRTPILSVYTFSFVGCDCGS